MGRTAGAGERRLGREVGMLQGGAAGPASFQQFWGAGRHNRSMEAAREPPGVVPNGPPEPPPHAALSPSPINRKS